MNQVPHHLKTQRLLLRCPRSGDGPALHAAVLESKKRLEPWFNWISGAVLTTRRSIASARFARWRFLAGRELQYFIFLQETEQLIGICGLCHPDWSGPQFEVRYWLRTGSEGQGYMTEAVTAVVNMACEILGAKRVELRCQPENKGSVALARRLGFKRTNRLPPEENVSEEMVFVYHAQ